MRWRPADERREPHPLDAVNLLARLRCQAKMRPWRSADAKESRLMYQVLLLICALGLQRSECTPYTALDVIQGPEASNLAACGLQSQAYLASTAIGLALGGREYPKILCIDSGIGPGNVG